MTLATLVVIVKKSLEKPNTKAFTAIFFYVVLTALALFLLIAGLMVLLNSVLDLTLALAPKWLKDIDWRALAQSGMPLSILGLSVYAIVIVRLFSRRVTQRSERFDPYFGLFLLAPVGLFLVSNFPYENNPLVQALQTRSWVDYWLIAASTFLFSNYVIDINYASLHSFYKERVARTYLLSHESNDEVNENFPYQGKEPKGYRVISNPNQRISNIHASMRSPYHLINAALNVPIKSSTQDDLRDRNSDFFLFSECYCGSKAGEYFETSEWEEHNDDLTLGTAIAISGAAVSSRAGVTTTWWMTPLFSWLNIRSGYWLKVPRRGSSFAIPGLGHFWGELLGLPVSKNSTFQHLSDGGHIENLGIYELLRRRCRFIIAVDAEADPDRNFSSLMLVTQYASIDFGIKIGVNLQKLRVGDDGHSQDYYSLWDVHYPDCGDYRAGKGLMLYIKASTTGDENDFLLSHKRAYPDFPHTPTLQQLYSERQFEAYRALGEHIATEVLRDDRTIASLFERLQTARSVQETSPA